MITIHGSYDGTSFSVDFADTASSAGSGFPVGAIVGGVVGGFVAVAIAGVIAFVVIKKKTPQQGSTDYHQMNSLEANINTAEAT